MIVIEEGDIVRQSKVDRYFSALLTVNFFVLFIVSMLIGGDGCNGHAEAGRYFLSNHGKLTETTRAVYWYSCIHVVITAIGIITYIIMGAVRELSKRE